MAVEVKNTNALRSGPQVGAFKSIKQAGTPRLSDEENKKNHIRRRLDEWIISLKIEISTRLTNIQRGIKEIFQSEKDEPNNPLPNWTADIALYLEEKKEEGKDLYQAMKQFVSAVVDKFVENLKGITKDGQDVIAKDFKSEEAKEQILKNALANLQAGNPSLTDSDLKIPEYKGAGSLDKEQQKKYETIIQALHCEMENCSHRHEALQNKINEPEVFTVLLENSTHFELLKRFENTVCQGTLKLNHIENMTIFQGSLTNTYLEEKLPLDQQNSQNHRVSPSAPPLTENPGDPPHPTWTTRVISHTTRVELSINTEALPTPSLTSHDLQK